MIIICKSAAKYPRRVSGSVENYFSSHCRNVHEAAGRGCLAAAGRLGSAVPAVPASARRLSLPASLLLSLPHRLNPQPQPQLTN